MATIQLGNTKVANKLITYAEKRSEVSHGVDCPSEYAKAQFKATRELWGKTDGIQAHHIIQSFKPGEVTPEVANEIGQQLARKIAKGHECIVYTHTDKDHIHNHIVINSVNYENGSKYQSSKKDLYKIREQSDQLCVERGLSVVLEPSAKQRYARAEYGLAKRGEMSWKDELREVIDYEKKHSKNYEEFKKNLTDKYKIEVKERGKNISFKHPEEQRYVRGKTLGMDYERSTIENVFVRENERTTGSNQERGNTDLSNEQTRGSNRVERVIGGDAQSQRFNEKLSSDKHGQNGSRKINVRQRTGEYQRDEQSSHVRNDFDIEKAKDTLRRVRRTSARDYTKFTERNEGEQRSNIGKNERNRENGQHQFDRSSEKNERRHERYRTKDHGLSR